MTDPFLVWFALPLSVSAAVCALMIRLGPKDAPDGGRKTQAAPVPSAGGIGILAGLAAALIAGAVGMPDHVSAGSIAQAGLAGPLLFVLLAGVLGFADDRWSLPAGRKLAVLAAGAVFAALYGPHIHHFWLPGAEAPGYPLAPFLAVAGAALWLFVMANAVNFMDGANGIALGSSAIMLTTLALLALPLALYATEPEAGLLVYLLLGAAAAVSGFLIWNLAGRLYAGDTGSLAIGALIGGAGLALAETYSVWVPATLALPFLVDVFLTLLWRARKGRPLMQAHRDHAYQLFLRAGWRHGQVGALWWAMTGVCAAAVLVGPAGTVFGLGAMGGAPGDAFVLFLSLLLAGCGLWIWQRATLGRQLEAGEAQ
ncbi:glycosyltransferase family 4 protein [Hyphomonas sp.]|uniref:glycosyltransferase family 4 protein n=1 Tax=Hyphomonas sp. TaxID=87 RepID=UPI00391AC69A